MSNYYTFLGKELMENLRTKKVLVLACVFAFFAITSPLLARYLIEFIGLFAGGDEMMETMIAAMGTPHWSESYMQLYSNFSQIGSITIILIYMGTIMREKSSGTADLVFTKGLSPTAFVLAKFTVAGIIIIIATMASVFIAYVYTLMLFEDGGQIGNVLVSGLIFTVFLLMLLAINMLFSALAKSSGTCAVFGLLTYFALALSTILMRIGQYSPGALMSSPLQVSTGTYPDGLVVSIIVAVVFTVLSLWAAVSLTAKRQAQSS